MDDRNKNEMEQIQKGLEEFLKKELETDSGTRDAVSGEGVGREAGEGDRGSDRGIGREADRGAGREMDRGTSRRTGPEADKGINRGADREIKRETYRRTGTAIHEETGRKTDREIPENGMGNVFEQKRTTVRQPDLNVIPSVNLEKRYYGEGSNRGYREEADYRMGEDGRYSGGGYYEGEETEEYNEWDYEEEQYEEEEYEEGDSEVEVVDWDLAKRGTSGRRTSGKRASGREAERGPGTGSSSGGRSSSRSTGNSSGGRSGSRSTGNSSGGRSGSRSTGNLSGDRSGSSRVSGTGSSGGYSGQDRGRSRGQSPGRAASGGGSGKGRSGRRNAEEQDTAGKAAAGKASVGNGSGKKSGKKKKSRLKARLCKLLIAAVVIVALLGFGMYQLVGLAYGKMNYREIAALTDAPLKEDGVVNILLIGNDSRENGEDGRSDAMILLSVSSRTKTIYMTSLLRDIYVDIPGYDGNRLNAAYSFGGAELLMETIEKNFDISVNRYILVNFEAFAGLIDAVDGIELELTSEEIDYVNGYLVEYNMLTERPQGTDNMDTSVSGLVHLNGPQALAYSRIRYLGTDFGRTERQRKVLTAVIGKLPKALLTNTGGVIDGLMPNLTTNLTQYECMQLCLMAGKLLSYDIVSDSIPQSGTYNNATIRGMSVLEVDFETNKRYLKEKIYGE